MKSIIKYTILTATRDWLFLGLAMLLLLTFALSIFLGSTTLSEQEMTSIVYMGGISRIITIIGLVLFVCFHVRRSFENKEVELILSRPISRSNFVLSYFLGFAVLSLMVVCPIVVLFAIVGLLGYIPLTKAGLLLWGISFYFETITIVALAFFSALILSSAIASVLFCFGFYFLARIFGFFLISINNPMSTAKSSAISRVAEKVLDYIGIVIPRFDMLTKSEWLIYNIEAPMQAFVLLSSVLLYIPFILAMALFDFSRKQF
jgi:ABC-type transport system involved in multi-copper enzyme maturation permease subunit